MAGLPTVSIQVEKWTVDNVADWIKGLDDSISVYAHNFQQHQINGRRLMLLDWTDLQKMGVWSVGHQELVLQSLEMLRSAYQELSTCNLQKIALKVTCRVNNLYSLLRNSAEARCERTVIDSVTYLVQSLKELIAWLSKAPFTNMEEFGALHGHMVQSTLSIISVFTRSSKIQSALTDRQAHLQDKLKEIWGKCDDLIKNCAEPVAVTPAYVDYVTIRKRSEEQLGLQLQSTVNGVHTIRKIKENTACGSNSRIEEGDEIVQVNNRTVIGWQLKNVVQLLRDSTKEVSFTIKKTPRHNVYAASNQRRPSPQTTALNLGDDLKQSTLPKVQRSSNKHSFGAQTEDSVGLLDSKPKSLSVSDHRVSGSAKPVGVSSVSEVHSVYDDVFASEDGSDRVSVYRTDDVLRRQTVSGRAARKAVRPTVLVGGVFENKRDSSLEEVSKSGVGESGSATVRGKTEIISSFHVVKSTPELRSPGGSTARCPLVTLSQATQDIDD